MSEDNGGASTPFVGWIEKNHVVLVATLAALVLLGGTVGTIWIRVLGARIDADEHEIEESKKHADELKQYYEAAAEAKAEKADLRLQRIDSQISTISAAVSGHLGQLQTTIHQISLRANSGRIKPAERDQLLDNAHQLQEDISRLMDLSAEILRRPDTGRRLNSNSAKGHLPLSGLEEDFTEFYVIAACIIAILTLVFLFGRWTGRRSVNKKPRESTHV